MKPIGVLAVQGAFIEHEARLSALAAPCFEIRQKGDLLRPMGGLILPGGESTVMGKLLKDLELWAPIRALLSGGLPVFGTCAGLILLAKRLTGGEAPHLALMDVTVSRNAYGRQLGSFHTRGAFGTLQNVPMTFIRAPVIEEVLGRGEVLSRVDGKIVAAREDNMLVTAFHPELDEDTRVHEYFLSMAENREKELTGR